MGGDRGCGLPGSAIPSLQGEYFFGDLNSREYWSFAWDPLQGIVGGVVDRTSAFTPAQGRIDSLVAFGTDGQGEIRPVDLYGEVYALPEPGALLGLGSGILVLAAAAALRGRAQPDLR